MRFGATPGNAATERRSAGPCRARDMFIFRASERTSPPTPAGGGCWASPGTRHERSGPLGPLRRGPSDSCDPRWRSNEHAASIRRPIAWSTAASGRRRPAAGRLPLVARTAAGDSDSDGSGGADPSAPSDTCFLALAGLGRGPSPIGASGRPLPPDRGRAPARCRAVRSCVGRVGLLRSALRRWLPGRWLDHGLRRLRREALPHSRLRHRRFAGGRQPRRVRGTRSRVDGRQLRVDRRLRLPGPRTLGRRGRRTRRCVGERRHDPRHGVRVALGERLEQQDRAGDRGVERPDGAPSSGSA